MENSLIIKFFAFIIKKFMVIYNNSGLEKVIDSVCGFFKSKAKGSVVCNYLSDSKKAGAYWKNSAVFKTIISPLRFVMFLADKFSSFFEKITKGSRIISLFDNIFNIPLKQYAKIMWGYV